MGKGKRKRNDAQRSNVKDFWIKPDTLWRNVFYFAAVWKWSIGAYYKTHDENTVREPVANLIATSE